ncbi:MAG TPA: hypothetical protein VMT27_07785 [Actinomycetes bacterium]|nr:hypothetical protein [Actinomycetes bacterium]
MAYDKYREWTPQQHIDTACNLLEACEGYSHRATGNAPIGLTIAGVHAELAQAKAMLSVIEVRR